MALSAKLELRQAQGLVMTPQLQQAIKLLQLSNLDLAAYVEAELERNPLLEQGEPEETGSGAEASEPEVRRDGEPAHDGDEGWLDLAASAGQGDAAEAFDTDIENVFPEAAEPAPAAPGAPADGGWTALRSGGGEGGEANLEAFVAKEVTLHDHLREQLPLAIADPARRLIGQHLIDLVDESGYLRGELDAVAERLSAPLALVEETLAVLQTFDPAGVFARDLRECLALQLKERDRYDPAMQAFIARLDLLAARDFAALRRVCCVDDEDLADMIAEVKSLSPKPGLRFGATPVQPVVPDVLVRQLPDGGWHVELNSATLPRVLVNRSYYATVSRTARSSHDKTYLQDCLQTANWLAKSLDQRARTILKVAREIVRQQDAFFAHGVQHLRPLNLRTVADAIAMHESTVSRVTANKYMATPRGIFELKYFFTSAIAAAGDGEAHSSEAVRHRIKQLIDSESPDEILSDDRIVALLRADGIDIARRTVAKYREGMRIASSVQRRRDKRARCSAPA